MTELSLQTLNQQRKEELWASRIKQCRESGLRVQDWCVENGLSYHTYYKWQQRLYHRYTEKGPDFYEVNINRTGSQVVATVHIGMCSADIYSGADERTIGAVLKAIKAC